MESQYSSDTSDSDSERSYQSPILEKKEAAPLVEIEAKIKDGEDFPSLSSHSSVFLKNNIVLFGGRDRHGNLNNILNIFNLETKAWSNKILKGALNDVPRPRTNHTANIVGNTICIFGGYLSARRKIRMLTKLILIHKSVQ